MISGVITNMERSFLDPIIFQNADGKVQFRGARMVLMDVESGFWGIRRQLEALLGTQVAETILQQAGANGGASFASTLEKTSSVEDQGNLFADCIKAYQAAGFGRFDIIAAKWPIGQVVVRADNAFEAWMMRRNGQNSTVPVCAYSAGVMVGFINVVSDRRDVVCIEQKCQAMGDPFCEFHLLPATSAHQHRVVAFTPDPALGQTPVLPEAFSEPHLKEMLARLTESESLLRSVIENARHFAIYRVAVDGGNPYHGRVVLVSPSMQDLTGVSDIYDFSTWFTNLHPEDRPRIIKANQRALENGEAYNQVARIYNPREGRWRWVQTISNPGYGSEGNLTHFDGMVIDLTEQKEAELALQAINSTLEERVRSRTEEIERRRAAAESLRDIIGMINSSMPLEEFLAHAVDLATQQLGAGGCVLHQVDLDNEMITRVASFGMEGIFEQKGSRPFSFLKPSGGAQYVEALRKRLPVFGNYPPLPERVEEIRRDPSIPEPFKSERIALRQKFAGSFSVPLYIQEKLFGGMVFYYTEPQEFHEEQIQLGMIFAEQVAIALENARLIEETELRRQVAESLRATLLILNTERPLSEILTHIVEQAQTLLRTKAAAIHRVDPVKGSLLPQATVGLSPEYVSGISLTLGQGALGQAVLEGKPVVVNDTRDVFDGQPVYSTNGSPVSLDDELLARLQRFPDRYGAVLAVPLMVQHQVYGGLVLYYEQPHNIQQEDVDLAMTFAGQATLAIENAMLRAQAAEGAVLSERSRLARDLHDAVSQTLFSASLIAEVLPQLWRRDPDIAQKKLNELRQLTRGALSEMRTLLLELRPSALVDMELLDLLRHLGNAFTGRAGVTHTLSAEGDSDPSPAVKSVFYRIAQEALNNIAKYAQADHVEIILKQEESFLQMEVCDNGCGFDPVTIPPDSLGLNIMRERAASIGAQLQIFSKPGQGTTIHVTWKSGEREG